MTHMPPEAGARRAPLLELRGVAKRFGHTDVLRDVDLDLAGGEFLAVVGFSGSGKSTLVNLIAGLLHPDAGTIRLRGESVRGAGPDRGVVFQSYALLPWLTVQANVQLAVDAVHGDWSRRARRDEARRYVELVELQHAADRRPDELSGGMRQRVAVARALAMDPAILLLDEPLGALDALTRATLQREIDRICRAQRKTVLLVTNDVDEALLLADRIVALKPGPGATLGPSFDVRLERPRDRAALNRDPAFKKLRNEVTAYLLELAARRTTGVPGQGPPLPPLQPRDLLRGQPRRPS